MRAIAISILCCLTLGCGKDKAPSPALSEVHHRFAVVFPSAHKTHDASEAQARWQASLVKNLGHRGDTHAFMLTDIPLHDGGTVRQGCVYQHSVNSSQLLVVPSDDLFEVIVDRQKQKIGTMGVSGMTLHPHSSGEMILCFAPTPGTWILGVPLSDAEKTGAKPPVFDGNRVSWTWGTK